ncbi:hypothetical protein REPUB_Repub18cG0066100 [Reevesia pubescens]
MASDQVSRGENTTTERDIYVEKDKAPTMTTHFESLAEKARDESDHVTAGKETPHERTANVTVAHVFGADQNPRARHEFDSLSGKVGDMNVPALIVTKKEVNPKEKGEELNTHQAKSGSIAGDKEADKARKVREKQLEGRTGGPFAIGKFEVESLKDQKGMTGNEERESSGKEKDNGAKLGGSEEGGGEKQVQLSLEEISKLRAQAQQNETETIRAAEERYNRATESASQGPKTVADYAKEKGSEAKESILLQSTQYATEKGAQATDNVRQVAQQVAEKGAQAKDTVLQGTQHVAVQAKDTILDDAKKTSQYISEKGIETKDTAAEKIRQGYAATKDTLVSAGKTTVDYTVPKAEQAKDYALRKAEKAKDTAVDVGKNIASYAGEKAVATKDVTIEKGKEAAEFAGKVAVDVKDKAVATGWSAAHYTTEKVVEGTKVAAREVEGVAEYAGHKAVEIAAKPLGAAKEAAAAAGESMKEYTARKKEEKERELEAKKSTETQVFMLWLCDDESSYRQVENKEPSSENQQQEDLSRKAKEKTEEASKPSGMAMKEGKGSSPLKKISGEWRGSLPMKETFQGSSDPNKSGERQETEKKRQDEKKKEEMMRVGRDAKRQMEGVAITVESETEKTINDIGSAVEDKEERQTGVLGAIGETIVEIAQTTKDLVVGLGPSPVDQPKTETQSTHYHQ